MTILDSLIGSWTDKDLLNRIDELPNYTSLVIYGSGFTDQGAELLTRCANLKELQLVGTSMSDAGLRLISQLEHLDWLVIDRASVTDSGISTLSNLKKLNGLQLISTQASDEGFKTLRYLPDLTYLEATDHSLRNKELSLISQLPNLSSLRLASTTTEDTDFLSLSACRSLKVLSFDMPSVSERAIEEVKEQLLNCQFQASRFFRQEEKITFLSGYCFDLYELEEYELAWVAANDVLKWFPFNPAVRTARAFINFQRGNYPDYRQDLEKAREHASVNADRELLKMADELLSIRSMEAIKEALHEKLPRDLLLKRMRSIQSGQSPQLKHEDAYTKMHLERFRNAVAWSNSVHRNENERLIYERERMLATMIERELRDRSIIVGEQEKRRERDAQERFKRGQYRPKPPWERE